MECESELDLRSMWMRDVVVTNESYYRPMDPLSNLTGETTWIA